MWNISPNSIAEGLVFLKFHQQVAGRKSLSPPQSNFSKSQLQFPLRELTCPLPFMETHVAQRTCGLKIPVFFGQVW